MYPMRSEFERIYGIIYDLSPQTRVGGVTSPLQVAYTTMDGVYSACAFVLPPIFSFNACSTQAGTMPFKSPPKLEISFTIEEEI